MIMYEIGMLVDKAWPWIGLAGLVFCVTGIVLLVREIIKGE